MEAFNLLGYDIELYVDETMEDLNVKGLGMMPNLGIDILYDVMFNKFIDSSPIKLYCNLPFLDLPKSLKHIAYLHELGHYEIRHEADPFKYKMVYSYYREQELLADNFAISHGNKLDLMRLLKYFLLFYEATGNIRAMETIHYRLENIRRNK